MITLIMAVLLSTAAVAAEPSWDLVEDEVLKDQIAKVFNAELFTKKFNTTDLMNYSACYSYRMIRRLKTQCKSPRCIKHLSDKVKIQNLYVVDTYCYEHSLRGNEL